MQVLLVSGKANRPKCRPKSENNDKATATAKPSVLTKTTPVLTEQVTRPNKMKLALFLPLALVAVARAQDDHDSPCKMQVIALHKCVGDDIDQEPAEGSCLACLEEYAGGDDEGGLPTDGQIDEGVRKCTAAGEACDSCADPVSALASCGKAALAMERNARAEGTSEHGQVVSEEEVSEKEAGEEVSMEQA